ncbi:TPA: IclR family transcriptional regulator [Klebsiella oxytoca]|uniref:IclR family transcriptional regulator n=1 Tax=Klebsiella oxytoca TaxID=571 RepID=A0AAN5LDA6_KLEOX|nr:IclR family transcriptional regulator [Klebsiella oxytoca]
MLINSTTSVPALDKTIRICNYLFASPGATFSQIQQALSLPKSSTSSLLNALTVHRILRQEKGRFYLGLKLYEWGNKSLEQFDIRNIALPVLERVRDITGLTCHLGVLEDLSPIYILKLESNHPISIRTWEGKKLPLHSSGVGKALCAWLPQEKINVLLPEENLPRYTETTITQKSVLMEEFSRIRNRGWAYDNEEDCPGVYCIAAPVFDHNNHVIAAISVSGVQMQLPEEKIAETSTLIIKACRDLSKKMI